MTDPNDSQTYVSLPPKRKGALRALFAFRYSCHGIVATLRTQSAFRQETAAALVLIPAACVLAMQPIERLALIGTVLLVLMVELLNSAIEAIVDRISLEHHELSRHAKDCGSAAVLVALIICALAWGLIASPIFVRWLGRLA